MDKVWPTFVTSSQKINSLILVVGILCYYTKCRSALCCFAECGVVSKFFWLDNHFVFYLFNLNRFKILFWSQKKMWSKFLSASLKLKKKGATTFCRLDISPKTQHCSRWIIYLRIGVSLCRWRVQRQSVACIIKVLQS